MKKFIFGLIATVMFGFVGSAKEVNLPTKSNPNQTELTKIKVTISIDWGRKSRDCAGFGICGINVEIEFDPLEFVFRGTSNDRGNLVLELSDKGLDNLKSTFGSETMVLEEDYILSEDTCKALELRSGYTLKAGKYTAKQVEKGVYAIVL